MVVALGKGEGKRQKAFSRDSLRAVERLGGKHWGCTSSLSDLHTLRLERWPGVCLATREEAEESKMLSSMF